MDAKIAMSFGFRSVGKFRIFPPFDDKIVSEQGALSLSAVSSQFGLAFFGQNNTLKCVDTAVYRKHVLTKENFKAENSNFRSKFVELGYKICQLKCNCDGSFLAVTVHTGPNGCLTLIYDVRCFHFKYTCDVIPFCQIRLPCSVAGSTLACFEWNTAINDIFACCCTDGTVAVIQVHGIDKFTVQAVSNPGPSIATCLSWSPKGKQLVVGYHDCTLCQFKPNLQMTKKIEPVSESVLGFPPFSIIDVCWLSTTHFAVIYRAPPSSTNENRVSFVHVTVSKDHPPVFINLDDICYGMGAKLQPKYYILHVIEWKILICCSSNSMETAVVGWNSATKAWENWTLDEEERAELPLDNRKSETFPLGVALDVGAVVPQQPSPSDDLANLAAPILLLFSTDGLLCPFRVMNRNANAENLCKPVQTMFSVQDVKISRTINISPPAQVSESQALDLPPPLIQRGSQHQAAVNTINQQKSGESIFIQKSGGTPLFENKATSNVTPFSITGNAPSLSIASVQQPTVVSNIVAPPPPVLQENPATKILRQEIHKTINQLNDDFAKLRTCLKIPQIFTKTEEENLHNSTRLLNDAVLSIDSLSEDIKNSHQSIMQISRESIEQRIAVERCRVEMEKRRTPENQNLWRERPLAPSQQQTLNRLTAKISRNDDILNDIIDKFNAMLLDSVDKREKPKMNSLDLAYRTLTNMQSIIIAQRQRLAELQHYKNLHNRFWQNDMATCSSNLRSKIGEFPKDSQISTQNGSMFAHNKSLTSSFVDSPLKRFLQSRSHVPRRVSSPSTSVLEHSLSISKMIDEEEKKQARDIVVPKDYSTAERHDIVAARRDEITSKEIFTLKDTVVPRQVTSFNTSVLQPSLPISKMISEKEKKQAPDIVVPKDSAVERRDILVARRDQITAPKENVTSKEIFTLKENVVPSRDTVAPNLFSKSDQLLQSQQLLFAPSLISAAASKSSPQPAAAQFSFVPQRKEAPCGGGKPVLDIFNIKNNNQVVQAGQNKEPEVQHTLKTESFVQAEPIVQEPPSPPTPLLDEPVPAETVLPVPADLPAKNPQPPEPLLKASANTKPLSPPTPVLDEPPVLPAVPADLSAKNPQPPPEPLLLKASADTKTVVEPPPPKSDVVEISAENADMEADNGMTSSAVPQQPTTAAASPFFLFNLNDKLSSGDVTTSSGPVQIQSTTTTTQSGLGAGGFFTGLGGTPKPESAVKNVFGSPFGAGGSTAAATTTPPQQLSSAFGSLFGTPAASTTTGGTAFGGTTWSKWSQQPQQTAGSVFGGGGGVGGSGAFSSGSSVAQQGFGGAFGNLGAASTSPSTGTVSAFGSAQNQAASPVFGGKSTFGSSPGGGGLSIFGGSATFGGSPGGGFTSPAGASSTFGGSAFGSSSSAFGGSSGTSGAPSGGFAAFAKSNAPTFGALASGGGGSPGGSSAFGSFGAFGGGATQQPQQPQQQNQSSFSQWR